MIWTPEKVDALRQMRAEGLSMATMARLLKVTRSAISGKLARLEGRYIEWEGERRHKTRKRKYTEHITGDWDVKTFEPYAVRKERLAKERANVVR